MGLRVSGGTLAELFTDSAVGMFNLITSLDQFQARDTLEVLLEAENPEELLWKWLRELHYLFSTQKLVFKEFEYRELSEKKVWAACSGEYFDPRRHQSEREVKAVTHHGFKVTQDKSGWHAEVIFDI